MTDFTNEEVTKLNQMVKKLEATFNAHELAIFSVIQATYMHSMALDLATPTSRLAAFLISKGVQEGNMTACKELVHSIIEDLNEAA